MLVHNCTDLARAHREFPGLAHTLDEHVDVDLAEMKNLAIRKTERLGRPTRNSRWSSADLAQKAVNGRVSERSSPARRFPTTAGRQARWPASGELFRRQPSVDGQPFDKPDHDRTLERTGGSLEPVVDRNAAEARQPR
ncbi:hypothetical protein ACF09C_03620 [Streptomyces sp. NPDC014870]|uniref:hypothetical protein n=1 Tax=Streptomyces sp. NPDC014870 TaxID=3364925 RepID=UPI0036FC64F7